MKSFIIILISLFSALKLSAQDTSIATVTFSVKGNCEECKKRIENAADIKGVKYSNWDEKKQMITITYRQDKVSPNAIENAIAAGGHDTEHIAANSSAYGKLPSCCKYRDKKCETGKQ